MHNEQQSEYTNSPFEQLWWLNTVAPDTPWKENILYKDDQVAARWISVERGNFRMPHFTQTIGCWVNPQILNNDRFFNEQKNILTQQIATLSKKTHISLSPVNKYYLPFLWAGFTVRPSVTYRINDLSDTERLYQNFGSIVKKNIKSARNKVTIEESNEISPLHTLMEKTFHLQGRKFPYTREYMERICAASMTHNSGKLLYAYDKDGNLHSGVFYLYDSNVCYYLIAGTDPQFRNSGANSLLIWEGIKFAAEHSQAFDFEGSMIEGVEHFFRQFGGEQTIYYDVYREGIIGSLAETLKPYVKRMIHYK